MKMDPSPYAEAPEARRSRGAKRREICMKGEWFLYIIECRTGEFYTGIAEDVEKRVEQHNKGRACRYTKFRGPVRLIYSEFCGEYAVARERERKVKDFSKIKKLKLIGDFSPHKAGLEVPKITK